MTAPDRLNIQPLELACFIIKFSDAGATHESRVVPHQNQSAVGQIILTFNFIQLLLKTLESKIKIQSVRIFFE